MLVVCQWSEITVSLSYSAFYVGWIPTCKFHTAHQCNNDRDYPDSPGKIRNIKQSKFSNHHQSERQGPDSSDDIIGTNKLGAIPVLSRYGLVGILESKGAANEHRDKNNRE